MKIRIFILIGIFASSTLVMLVLYWFYSENGNIKNGFNRMIRHDAIRLLKSVQLPSDLYYFAGWRSDTCYLANPDIPLELIAINGSGLSRRKIENYLYPAIKVSKISIDSPYFYVADLYSYSIYSGNWNSWKIDKTVLDHKFFSESLQVGPTSIVLRSFNQDKTEYLLSKKSPQDNTAVDAPGLLQKQIDGLFCTDGMLVFDREKQVLLYTYYYRNQFICADTSLVLLYRRETIDTVSLAKIKVAKLSSKGISILASPPAVINRATYAYNGRLFINSNLIADNEDSKEFKASDVIDVYDDTTGDYLRSFYLPKAADQRLRHFAIRKNFLYVLRGDNMDVYSIPDQ